MLPALALLTLAHVGSATPVQFPDADRALPLAAWTDSFAKAGATSAQIVLFRDFEPHQTVVLGKIKDPVYQVGFLSRLPLLVVLFQLVDEGKIDLASPANSYLKSWKLPEDKGVCSVADLLLSKSGYDQYKFAGLPLGSPLPKLTDLLKQTTQTFAPGKDPHDSGVNFAILQLLVEDLTGKSLQTLAQERVFKPLNLTSSVYSALPPEQFKDRIAPGEKPTRAYPALASQGLWTNARDLAVLMSAVWKSAREESKILKPDTAKLLLTPNENGDTYGLNRSPLSEGGDLFLGGQNDGYTCQLVLQPTDGNGALVVTNGDMAWQAIDSAINDSFRLTSGLNLGDIAASFEPLHVSGPWADTEACPVCNYPLLSVALAFVQHGSDEEALAIASSFQKSVSQTSPDKLKAFIVISNIDGDFAKAKARAESLAKQSNTPNVWFVVIQDPDGGPLRDYHVDRRSKTYVVLTKRRSVKFAYRDVSADLLPEITKNFASLAEN